MEIGGLFSNLLFSILSQYECSLGNNIDEDNFIKTKLKIVADCLYKQIT